MKISNDLRNSMVEYHPMDNHLLTTLPLLVLFFPSSSHLQPQEFTTKVVEYIICTKTHKPSSSDSDLQFFLDMDMAVLGKTPEGNDPFVSITSIHQSIHYIFIIIIILFLLFVWFFSRIPKVRFKYQKGIHPLFWRGLSKWKNQSTPKIVGRRRSIQFFFFNLSHSRISGQIRRRCKEEYATRDSLTLHC